MHHRLRVHQPEGASGGQEDASMTAVTLFLTLTPQMQIGPALERMV